MLQDYLTISLANHIKVKVYIIYLLFLSQSWSILLFLSQSHPPFFVFLHVFLMLFHLIKMRFSRSNHLLICLSMEPLTFIIKTEKPILVELIELVNSCYNFFCLKWPALLYLFISSDASICSKVTFPQLEILIKYLPQFKLTFS